ncbi:hypothetical protein N665_1342s0003 [Sinapis alba]|nr:hypothetical protein N665_1342s0003 [Sinapis alba]
MSLNLIEKPLVFRIETKRLEIGLYRLDFVRSMGCGGWFMVTGCSEFDGV